MIAYLIISHLKRNGEDFNVEVNHFAYKSKEDATSEIKRKIDTYCEDGSWKKLTDYAVQDMNIGKLTNDTYTCEWEIQGICVVEN